MAIPQRIFLLPPKAKILGVRTPTLRKLAKEVADYAEDIFSFSDEYYETTFIKLTIASKLPYEKFVSRLDDCVALIDNWALCDCFKAKCIKKHKSAFLSVLQSMFARGGEYEQRYPLVVLLTEYVQKEYLPEIEDFIASAYLSKYYVYMAVAWLIAEVLVKEYEAGVALLNKRLTDEKTHNKAIQKAIESYRLTNEQKGFLRSLKIRK